ncbi:hypothetical protein EZJ19_07910 [Parasulfuritortus cantonensis]|uniref:Uncharacterized protein n=1 Tax=Parasulfuritortus cantonensis TaxID=2528202 RepID=A0A4R1BDU3_9PROT|nr:hypothetical protein [Parasulfuritortus cantonensis]TCJ15224.1 hypothetical protein EZJ19_07910 [Parasulfuritortus cantonensis]
MWATALKTLAGLKELPDSLVRYEWVKGYPGGYAFLEGAVGSLDDRMDEFLPKLIVDPAHPRKWIDIEATF